MRHWISKSPNILIIHPNNPRCKISKSPNILHRFHATDEEFWRIKLRIWALWGPRERNYEKGKRSEGENFLENCFFLFHERHVFCSLNIHWSIFKCFTVIWRSGSNNVHMWRLNMHFFSFVFLNEKKNLHIS